MGGVEAGLLCEVCLHQVPPVGLHFLHISTLGAKMAKNRGGPPFFETFFKGTNVKIHKDLALSREPYAGISRFIPYLRMRVGPSGEASQNFWMGAFEFKGGGGP